jgi:hypothetical protein
MTNVTTPVTAMTPNTMMKNITTTTTMTATFSDESVLEVVTEIGPLLGTVAEGDGDSVDDVAESVTELLVVAAPIIFCLKNKLMSCRYVSPKNTLVRTR